MIEIRVVGDPIASLSPNLRLHYLQRHRRVQDWKSRAWLAWLEANRPRVRRKVRVSLVVRRARRVDPDNAWASVKAILDGLTDEPGRLALWPNDSADWIEVGGVIFETGQRWSGREELLIRCEALDQEP